MSNPHVYTPEYVSEVRQSVAHCTTVSQALDVLEATLERNRDHCRRLQRMYRFYSLDGKALPLVTSSPTRTARSTLSDTGAEREMSIATTAPTALEDVVKMCKVDETKWKVKSFAVEQRRTGFAWRVSMEKRLEPIGADQMLARFIEDAAAHAPATWSLAKDAGQKAKVKDCLYVLNIQDLHLAKLAWSKETGGADWDIRISEQIYRTAVDELIARAPVERIEEVLVIIGSDLLQVDTDSSTTTAGTYVDSDSRLAKVFEVAAKLLTDVIEQLASRFKVMGIVIPGNHDAVSSMYLGHYVGAWFRNHPNVVIDTNPKSRKYYGYGKTLIGFDHGNELKYNDIPLTMMRENQATISQYRFSEMLIGHTHAEASEDIKGIIIRVAPALCPPDAWHAKHGFLGNMRRSQGLLYQRDNGLEAIIYSSALD